MVSKKERVELQFNMENKAEKEIIDFIDQNGTTRAGFIKSVIRQYMNTMQSLGTPTPNPEPENEAQYAPKENEQTNTKKKIPKLGASFSSKDLE